MFRVVLNNKKKSHDGVTQIFRAKYEGGAKKNEKTKKNEGALK